MENIKSKFQISNIKLLECDLNLRKIYESESDGVEVNFSVDYDVKIDSDDNYYNGVVEFGVKACAMETQFASVAVQAKFDCLKSESSEDKFKQMCELNGLTTLSQITRAYLVNITSFTGLQNSLVLPMINIYELIKQKNKSNSE